MKPVVILFQAVPNWYMIVMTSRLKPLHFRGMVYDDSHNDEKDERILEDDPDRHSCICDKTWNEEHDHKKKDRDIHGCGHEEPCDEERGLERRNQDIHGCDREEKCDEERAIERRDRDIHGCSCEEKRDEECTQFLIIIIPSLTLTLIVTNKH